MKPEGWIDGSEENGLPDEQHPEEELGESGDDDDESICNCPRRLQWRGGYLASPNRRLRRCQRTLRNWLKNCRHGVRQIFGIYARARVAAPRRIFTRANIRSRYFVRRWVAVTLKGRHWPMRLSFGISPDFPIKHEINPFDKWW